MAKQDKSVWMREAFLMRKGAVPAAEPESLHSAGKTACRAENYGLDRKYKENPAVRRGLL